MRTSPLRPKPKAQTKKNFLSGSGEKKMCRRKSYRQHGPQSPISNRQNQTNFRSAPTVPVGQIFLAAPDVDATVFRNLASAFRTVAQRTTLYVSSKDQALASSGALHYYPRAGYIPPVTIVPGIDTIEVSDVDISLLGTVASRRLETGCRTSTSKFEDRPPPRFGLLPIQTPDGQRLLRIGN